MKHSGALDRIGTDGPDEARDANVLTDEPAVRQTRFQFVDDVALESLPQPEWLIDGVLPKGGLAVLYGEAGSYKSFVGVDWSMCIATGQQWAGREVERGAVVYVAAEGASGYFNRVQCWKGSRSYVGRAGVQFLTHAIQLTDSTEVGDLVTSIKENEIDPVLVVLDTFSRCFVGADENSASAVSEAIESMEKIRRGTGATVLLVHHSTKDGVTERGSTALRGGVDVMVVAKKKGTTGHVSLQCAKMKDADHFKEMHFRFEKRGESGVLVPTDATPERKNNARKKLTKKEQTTLDALPSGGAKHGDWKERAIRRGAAEGSFGKHRKFLVEQGHVVEYADGIYRPRAADASSSIE